MGIRCKAWISSIVIPVFGGAFPLLLVFVLLTGRSYGQQTTIPSDTWKSYSGPPLPGEEAAVTSRPWARKLQFASQSNSDSGKQANLPPAPTVEKKKSGSSATSGSPGHIYWVIPAYKVNYSGHFQPLTPKEKFHEWAQGVYDPLGFGVTAFEAGTLEHSSKDGFCGYGHGWDGYGKCFGSLELDSTISGFIGDYALAVWWHQDPRYFRLGRDSFGKRVFYAISRVFVTYNDSGNTVFNSSALSGTAIASGLSNLYAPKSDRGFSHSLSRVGIDLGNTALYNAAAEFWPDIHHGLRHMF